MKYIIVALLIAAGFYISIEHKPQQANVTPKKTKVDKTIVSLGVKQKKENIKKIKAPKLNQKQVETKLIQLDKFIASERFVEFANKGSLTPEQIERFRSLLQQRNQLFKQKIDLIMKGVNSHEQANI